MVRPQKIDGFSLTQAGKGFANACQTAANAFAAAFTPAPQPALAPVRVSPQRPGQ